MRSQYEIKVWREPNWPEGSSMLWRAQVFENRKRVASIIGIGSTREEAIENVRRLFDANPGGTAEWVPLEADVVAHV